MSINEWTGRENVVCICNGIVFSLKKEGNAAVCDNINEPGRHYVKWDKPVTGQILWFHPDEVSKINS